MGATGSDTIDGGEGNDLILGRAGGDSLSGGAGNDSLQGGDGNDSLVGGAGDDRLVGQEGNDTLVDGNGADTLLGYAGNDFLNARTSDAESGSQFLSGGFGEDILYGDGGDTLEGGADNDAFVVFGENDTAVAPVIVTDFVPGADSLAIDVSGVPAVPGPVPHVVTTQLSSGGTGVDVLVNGTVYAQLQGVTNPASVTVSLTTGA